MHVSDFHNTKKPQEQLLALTLAVSLVLQTSVLPLLAFAVTNNDTTTPEISCATSTSVTLSDGTETWSLSNEQTGNAVVVTHPAWSTLTSALFGTAKWIWNSPEVSDPKVSETVNFSKTFNLPANHLDGSLTLLADDHYSVTINGILVGSDQGSASSWQTETTLAVPADILHEGANTVVLSITNNAAPEATYPDENPAGTSFRLEVGNSPCETVVATSTEPSPSTLQVHLLKYLDNDLASTVSVNNSEFVIKTDWFSQSTGTGTSEFVLGTSTGETPISYTADSIPLSAPANFQLEELTSQTGTVVNPEQGCAVGQFRLRGYKIGDTLDQAIQATLTQSSPILTGITSDKYVIIVNEKCIVGGEMIPGTPTPPLVPNTTVGTAYTYGCTNASASNYNPSATSDDNTCILPPSNTPTGDTATNTATTTGLSSTPLPETITSPGEVLGVSTTTIADEDLSCGMYLNSYLRKGTTNSVEVKKLQSFLNTHIDSKLPVNGKFGPLTTKAVNSFQVKYQSEVLQPWVDAGLMPKTSQGTGYVFKTTKRWINKLNCSSLDIPLPSLP